MRGRCGTEFVGRTKKGDIDKPIDCFSWGDFERKFGGLLDDGPMTYAVRDFFLNGGGHAIIVRIARGASAAGINIDDLFDVAANTRASGETTSRWR